MRSGKPRQELHDLEAPFVRLEERVKSCNSGQGPGTTNFDTLLPLSRRIESLAASHDKQILRPLLGFSHRDVERDAKTKLKKQTLHYYENKTTRKL